MNEFKKDGTFGVDIYATGKGKVVFDMRFDNDCRKKFDMRLEDAVDLAKTIADKCKEEVEMQLIKGFFIEL